MENKNKEDFFDRVNQIQKHIDENIIKDLENKTEEEKNSLDNNNRRIILNYLKDAFPSWPKEPNPTSEIELEEYDKYEDNLYRAYNSTLNLLTDGIYETRKTAVDASYSLFDFKILQIEEDKHEDKTGLKIYFQRKWKDKPWEEKRKTFNKEIEHICIYAQTDYDHYNEGLQVTTGWSLKDIITFLQEKTLIDERMKNYSDRPGPLEEEIHNCYESYRGTYTCDVESALDEWIKYNNIECSEEKKEEILEIISGMESPERVEDFNEIKDYTIDVSSVIINVDGEEKNALRINDYAYGNFHGCYYQGEETMDYYLYEQGGEITVLPAEYIIRENIFRDIKNEEQCEVQSNVHEQ